MIWQFDEAKDKMNEIVTRALSDGPQRINCHGQIVVILSEDDFSRLNGKRVSFTDYLLQGPDISELDLARDQSPMREVAW